MKVDSDNKVKILILATDGVSTNIIFNAISKQYINTTVIIENKISRVAFIKNRIIKLGIFKTVSQVIFSLIIPKILNFYSKKQKATLIERYQLNLNKVEPIHIIKTNSVNNIKTHNLIKEYNPDIIIVNGTRILSKNTINQLRCPIINIHTGITPFYRGVHGGYWSKYNNDINNFGTTIHFLDTGIDTGKIIKQFKVIPENEDNYETYPLLQYGIIIRELPQIIQSVINKTEPLIDGKNDIKGKLWYHPGVFQYIYSRIFRGVK